MLSITTSTGHKLDLFPDTTISIEENSPMFTDIGSYSLPVELPPTPGNLEALDFPDRVQRRARFVKSTRVTLACGPYSRVCRMHIDSAVHRSTISATLYLRESNFYNAIKGVRLQELFEDKVRKDFTKISGEPLNPSDPPTSWLSYLNRVMCGDIVDDFHIFPVLLDTVEHEDEIVNKHFNDGSIQSTAYWKQFIISNTPFYLRLGDDIQYQVRSSASGKEYFPLAGNIPAYREGVADNNNSTLLGPSGYGVAPYLKLMYVLREGLSLIGYELAHSVLDSDYSFQHLCIIHPTVDALVRGELNYSQLLPDVELDDLLRLVENSFGLRFSVDEDNKVVTPRFWRDLLQEDPVADFSSLIRDYPQVSYAGNRNIKLSTIPSMDDEPSGLRFESWQQLQKRYGSLRGSYASPLLFQTAVSSGLVEQGVYLIRSVRRLAVTFRPNPMQPTEWSWQYVDRYMHDYIPPGSDIPLEERELGFMLVQYKSVPLIGRTNVSVVTETTGYWKDMADKMNADIASRYPSDNGIVVSLANINSIQHLNTVMETVNVDENENETVSYSDDGTVQVPIHLAFAHGFAAASSGMPGIERTFFSSQDAYNNNGSVLGTFDLMPLSLYQNFWERYDQLLETSFHDFSARINLTLPQIMSLRFDKPVTVRGSTALPLSLTYSLSHKGVEVIDFTLRIITPYE